ncbi:MAG: hypothetical protein V1911_01195 [Candidatus Micrarchaeota archaeon]
MNKRGFLFSVMMFMLVVTFTSMMMMYKDRSGDQKADISALMAKNRITNAWNDVSEEIGGTLGLNITKAGGTVIFEDLLPAEYDIIGRLGQLDEFVRTYYAEPNLNISFVSASGEQILLSSMEPMIMLKPYNIIYGYLDFGKNELFIDVPAENFSVITLSNITLRLENAYFNCDIAMVPPASDDCNKWAPLSRCKGNANDFHMNLTIIDANDSSFTYPEQCFDAAGKSTANLNVVNESSNFFLKIQIGPLDRLVWIKMQNVRLASKTLLLLNTEDFYVNYPSRLKVSLIDGTAKKESGM